MHPEVRQEGPGRCPKCGMALVKEEDAASAPKHHAPATAQSFLVTYKPLLIIVGLIALATLVLAVRDAQADSLNWETTMRRFMAGFFLVFSGFKLMDVKGFAQGYSTYDLLAKRVYAYGYVYPFLELALGLLYLTQYAPYYTDLFTLILMAFSGLGVGIKVAKREKIQCACLGTIIQLPLTNITLVEDFGMAAMALVMLVR